MKKIIEILTVAILMSLINACSSSIAEKREISQSNYKTVDVEQIEYTEQIKATGILSYKNQYKLSFKIGGIIKSIDVSEGQTVNAGQQIAEVFKDEISSQNEQAKLAVDKAERDYKRIEALYADTVVTLEQFQNAKSLLDNARLNYKSASFNLQYSSITTPTKGKIQKILMQENEIVSAGMPVIVLGDIDNGKVLKTNLTDIDIVKVQLGDSCEIRFDAWHDRIFTGIVSEISGTADPYTSTYEIEIIINDKKNLLKSGFIGDATINSSNKAKFYGIPIESLVSADGMNGKVKLLENSKSIIRDVEIAKIMNDILLISTGLSANDKIIIE